MIKINNVYAYSYYDLPYEVKSTFENFFEYLNNSNEDIYNIIDSSNSELMDNISEYLHGIDIIYEVENINVINSNHYKIDTKISANGIGWNVTGFSTYYEIKLINDGYKIVNTNLFDVIGTENILYFILKKLAIVGGIISGIGLIVLLIILMVIKNKKTKVN